jgi:hypothetical protein
MTMGTDSFLAIACAGLIGLLFGMALTFAGYRLFYFLLPLWGFIFGLAFGAQAMQALFGEGFLSTITSWVVGFIVGAVFALLSYLFWVVAVAVVAGGLGYTLTVGLLGYLGMDLNWLVWILGVVVGAIFIGAALFLNLQKWIVIIGTAVLGAGAVIGTFVLMFNPNAGALASPVKVAMSTSPLLTILFWVLAIAGIVVQYQHTRRYTIESYNRWAEMNAAPEV